MIAEYPISRGNAPPVVGITRTPHPRMADARPLHADQAALADLEQRRQRLQRITRPRFQYVEVPGAWMPQRAIVAAETTLAWARADLGLRGRPSIVWVESEADLTRLARASLERHGARVHGHQRQVVGWIEEQGVMYLLARGTIGPLRAVVLHESWHFLEAQLGAFEVPGGHDPRAEAYARRLAPAPFDSVSYAPSYP